MKYLLDAVQEFHKQHSYVDIEGDGCFVNTGVNENSNRLYVTLQDGPIKEVGVNGIQVTELLLLVKEMYKSLNSSFPCRENSLTITKIEEAIHWQDARTKDRENRKVEGKNEL